MIIDRGIALHKMIRLLTSTLVGEGYLNFMGNEFGHPEWIDFPREGNGWSYHYCRRQWSLADNGLLRYEYLRDFDMAMIKLLKKERLMTKKAVSQWMHNDDKIIMYTKNKLAFAFNFHPTKSYDSYFVPVEEEGTYSVVMSSDDESFGGFNRVDKTYKYVAAKRAADGKLGFDCYLPNRTAIVFKKDK